jgi:glycosyltransferase involved in cell wall biosynthesis
MNGASTMPRISVLLPTYNAAPFLSETLESILSQTEPDFELIVLDDHSEDATVEIVRAVIDPRVRLHVTAVNLGTPANINIGLAMARGAYIARIDHDDIAVPDRFSLQARFLDENIEVVILGGQIEHFHDQAGRSDFPLNDAGIKARLIDGGRYMANPTTMIRAEFVRRHRLRFDPNLYVVDDLGFIFDATAAGGRLANLPDVLINYRIHAGMASMNLEIDRLFQSKARLYQRMLPTYFPAITGAECERLLDLYRFKHLAPSDMSSLSSLVHAAGRALAHVGESLGQDRVQVADVFGKMLLDHVNAMINDAKTITYKDFKEILEPIYLGALNQPSQAP